MELGQSQYIRDKCRAVSISVRPSLIIFETNAHFGPYSLTIFETRQNKHRLAKKARRRKNSPPYIGVSWCKIISFFFHSRRADINLSTAASPICGIHWTLSLEILPSSKASAHSTKDGNSSSIATQQRNLFQRDPPHGREYNQPSPSPNQD